MRVVLEGKSGSHIAGSPRFEHHAHIARYAGHALETRLFIQHAIELLGVAAAVLQKVNQDTRVNRTGPAAHHESFERGEAHGGIDARSVTDRGQRTSISEMASDQAKRFQ